MFNPVVMCSPDQSLSKPVAKWLAAAALVGFGLAAMAQAEPTLNQVYEATQSGKLEQAQVMMQQVLVAHPSSAKAHFVQAELFAKQGQMGRARDALASADNLAPGLPFAKADSVQNLRAQLAAKGTLASGGNAAAPAPAPASSFPWGIALALGGGAIGFGIYMSRKKTASAQAFPPSPGQPGYGNPGGTGGGIGAGLGGGATAMQGGLGGPQSFGSGAQPAYPPAYPPGYGQPAGSGLGGKVMGGLAAGLAVGAGVMAAQAIGKSMMGNNEHGNDHARKDAANNNAGSNAGGSSDYQPFAASPNSDSGGQNFGVNDSGSWDDNSSVADSGGGGGDWDS